jgi:hypothetical protein
MNLSAVEAPGEHSVCCCNALAEVQVDRENRGGSAKKGGNQIEFQVPGGVTVNQAVSWTWPAKKHYTNYTPIDSSREAVQQGACGAQLPSGGAWGGRSPPPHSLLLGDNWESLGFFG